MGEKSNWNLLDYFINKKAFSFIHKIHASWWYDFSKWSLNTTTSEHSQRLCKKENLIIGSCPFRQLSLRKFNAKKAISSFAWFLCNSTYEMKSKFCRYSERKKCSAVSMKIRQYFYSLFKSKYLLYLQWNIFSSSKHTSW